VCCVYVFIIGAFVVRNTETFRVSPFSLFHVQLHQ